jgi:integrase
MRVNLTDARIRDLKPAPAGRRYDVYDSQQHGLLVRVTANGAKTFMLRTRPPGSKHFVRRSIGKVGDVSIDEARITAGNWLAMIRRGLDPAQETRAQQREQKEKESHTFEAVARDWLARAQRGKRKAKELEKEVFPEWGKRPLASITRNDVVQLVEQIVDRPAPGVARHVFAHVRACFNWAIGRSIYGIEASPCDRLKPRVIIGPKNERDRVLNDAELRAFWRATEQMDYPWGPLLRLLLLTGCRRSEIGEAHWSEFDLDDAKLLTIPRERFKSNAEHPVPLAPDALAILNELPRFKKGKFVFSTTYGDKPVRSFSKPKRDLDCKMLKELRKARGDDAKLPNFTIHDLRRTVRTRLAQLRVPAVVAELVIGHSQRGLARIYDQHAYLDEMREALVAWEDKLRTIVNPPSPAPTMKADNVVQLKASA